MSIRKITSEEFKRLSLRKEDLFFDRKRPEIKPQQLQETVVAFTNSEGGQICIGINDTGSNAGFSDLSGYDGIIKDGILGCQPSIGDLSYEILEYESKYILLVEIPKSEKVHATTKAEVYLRVGASNKKLNQDEISTLKYRKGELKFEDQTKNIELEAILKSCYLKKYLQVQQLSCSPEEYLVSNGFVFDKKPKVSSIVCFHDRPQSILKCGVKINIYEMSKTSRKYIYERTRKKADKNVFGPLELLINNSLDFINTTLKDMEIAYPREAITEGFVNAVVHRDYSISEDIIVDIYDNQIIIASPGGFPGRIKDSDLNARRVTRYLRNPVINNMLFSISAAEEDFHDRLNQDQGEGIRTIFNSMKKAGLSDPIFKESDNRVILYLKHENAQSYEKKILDYLERNESIANREARELLGEEDKERIKNVFKKLENNKKIKRLENNVPTSRVRYIKYCNQISDCPEEATENQITQGRLL